MQPVGSPCLLPRWFDEADLPDQAALILNCTVVNGELMREAERRRAELAEWIRRGE
jgi:hypothetical protein